MTTPSERRRALKNTWLFLEELCVDKKQPFYAAATNLLRHYPHPIMIDFISEEASGLLLDHIFPIDTASVRKELETENALYKQHKDKLYEARMRNKRCTNTENK